MMSAITVTMVVYPGVLVVHRSLVLVPTALNWLACGNRLVIFLTNVV